MTLVSRYISRTVTAAVLLVLLVLVGLDSITVLIDELNNLRRDYDFAEALIYTALTIPSRIYEYMPLSILIGCLAGLGVLANNSELVVMRSVGISIYRLIWMVMKSAIVIMVFGGLLGEFLAPQAEQFAQSRRAVAESGNGGFTSRSGLWHREGNHFMHFNAVQPNGVLHGVTLLGFSETLELKSATYAKRASYINGEWLLEGVEETLLDAQHTQRVEESTREWATALTPNLLNLVIVPPENLSIRGLAAYTDYLQDQGLDKGDYELAYWERLLQPLSIAALVLVAISFIFGPLRDSTMGFRIFVGVVVGIAFQTSQDLLGPASLVFGFSPLYAVLAPVCICGLTGIYLLNRVR